MAIGAAVALGAPGGAGATPTWNAASPLSGVGAGLTDTAMGLHGDIAVTWDTAAVGGSVQIATRSPFGSFSHAIDLSPAGALSGDPQVAEDASGEATAVWYASTDGSNYLVEAATVADGIPSAPVKLSAAGQNAAFPTVAVNEMGDAIVAWRRSNGANEIVQASFRPAGGSFGVPVNLSPEGRNGDLPRVAIDAAGDATVVWDSTNGGPEVVEEATRSAAIGSFAKPVVLSKEAEPAQEPVVAMNAEGDTAIAWIRSNGSNEVVQAVTRPAGAGGFGTLAEQLSLPGAEALNPEIALDGQGDPTVVWWLNTDDIQASTGTSSGKFPATPEGLAPFGLYPSVAEDSAGDTVVGYIQELGAAITAAASFRPAGGQFTAPRDVSPTGQEVLFEFKLGDENGLNVAVDGDGDGVFGFSAATGGEFVAQASLLDASGPLLKNLSIPAAATVGVPVTVSVAPVDAFSEPSTASWSFGDAFTANGSSATHAFANPGTYTATVRATDAVGNSTTQTSTIVVTARPASLTFKTASLETSTVDADSHGRVHLRVACPPGGAACAGTVTMTLPATASGLALAARAPGTPVSVAAGDASFSAAAGASTTVSMVLPAPVLRLLKRHRHLTLTVALESLDGSGHSTTTSGKVLIKAYVKPKKPKRTKKKNVGAAQ